MNYLQEARLDLPLSPLMLAFYTLLVCIHAFFSFRFAIFFHLHFLLPLPTGLAFSQLTPNSYACIIAFNCLCYLIGIPSPEKLLHCFHNLMVNKLNTCRVDLIGCYFFTITHEFVDKPHDWKQEFFFASSIDLDDDDLRGEWCPLDDFNLIYLDVDLAREFSAHDQASYRQLARHVDNRADLT